MSTVATQRRLSAIMFTDIVGFSTLMGRDEALALELLDLQQRIVRPSVERYDGEVLKAMGDGLLVEFASSVNAVQCALEVQESIRRSNESTSTGFQIRIGIHLGDVVVLGNDILGEGVNIAARVEPLASPGGICMTQAVYQSVKSTLQLDGERIDEVRLKNIDDEYTLYTIPRSPIEGRSGPGPYQRQLARIQLEEVLDETDVRAEWGRVARAIWLPLAAGVILFSLPGLLLGARFAGEGMDETGRLAWFASTALLIAALYPVGLAVSCHLLHRRTIRLSLTDVRHVATLLDMLILRMHYGLQHQRGNELEYLHGPAKWKERKAFAWVKRADTLTLRFDGNRVTVSGPYIHVKKLLKEIRRHGPKGDRLPPSEDHPPLAPAQSR